MCAQEIFAILYADFPAPIPTTAVEKYPMREPHISSTCVLNATGNKHPYRVSTY